MEPTQELIDAIYRDKVLDARRMSPRRKLELGPELFEYACSITRAGIRHQHPNADEEEVERILRRRLEIGRILESRPVPEDDNPRTGLS